MTYAQYLASSGGVAACGKGFGVMVTPMENIHRVPAGWVFVPLEEATEELVQEALDFAKGGMANWPQKEEYNLPKRSKANAKKARTHF
ncbi:hypothetical protein LCGC14_1666340 [marine sediment metagenome]|uniref:Uncharacterized protein n=1 Tax=marine sediment metagenome TaxID=412755 RepID=A0A0F9IF68_9ZZZZ